MKKILRKGQSHNSRKELNNNMGNTYSMDFPDYIRSFSPCNGAYKLINKTIVWKLPNATAFPLALRKNSSAASLAASLAASINKVTLKQPREEAKIVAVQYGHSSKGGAISMKQKPNQDSALACSDFCRKAAGEASYFFVVADGHGTFGERVSAFVTNSIKCNELIVADLYKDNSHCFNKPYKL